MGHRETRVWQWWAQPGASNRVHQQTLSQQSQKLNLQSIQGICQKQQKAALETGPSQETDVQYCVCCYPDEQVILVMTLGSGTNSPGLSWNLVLGPWAGWAEVWVEATGTTWPNKGPEIQDLSRVTLSFYLSVCVCAYICIHTYTLNSICIYALLSIISLISVIGHHQRWDTSLGRSFWSLA